MSKNKLEKIKKTKETLKYTEYACTNMQFMANMADGSYGIYEQELSIAGEMIKNGETTYNADHVHEFVVDENGNGTAKQVCHPDHPNICHSHKIINWIVQPAMSKDIDSVYGAPNHIHHLLSKKV